MGPLDMFFLLFLQLLVNEGPLVSLQPCKLLKVIAESWLLIVKYSYQIPVTLRLGHPWVWMTGSTIAFTTVSPSHQRKVTMTFLVWLMPPHKCALNGFRWCSRLQDIYRKHSLGITVYPSEYLTFPLPLTISQGNSGICAFLGISEALLKLSTAALAVFCIPGGSLPGCSI